MRINFDDAVQNSGHKVKRTEKAEEKKKKRTKADRSLSKNYKSTRVPEIDVVDIDLTRMFYGIIEYMDPKYIDDNGQIIETKNGWVEVINFYLYCIYSNDKENFIKNCIYYGITNNNFNIDKSYGKVKFTDNEYVITQIYDTEYYSDILNKPRVIFNALVACTKALWYENSRIKYHVEKHNRFKLKQISDEEAKNAIKITDENQL